VLWRRSLLSEGMNLWASAGASWPSLGTHQRSPAEHRGATGLWRCGRVVAAAVGPLIARSATEMLAGHPASPSRRGPSSAGSSLAG